MGGGSAIEGEVEVEVEAEAGVEAGVEVGQKWTIEQLLAMVCVVRGVVEFLLLNLRSNGREQEWRAAENSPRSPVHSVRASEEQQATSWACLRLVCIHTSPSTVYLHFPSPLVDTSR